MKKNYPLQINIQLANQSNDCCSYVKPFYKIISLLLLISLFSNSIRAQLFHQNFNSSTILNNYNSSAPTNQQFDTLISTGAGTVIIIDTTNSNKLRFASQNDTGAYIRSTDFSTIPNSIMYQFDITITPENPSQLANASYQTTAALWQIGSGFTNAVSSEPLISVYSQIGLNFEDLNLGQFSLRDSLGHQSSAAYTGTQHVTWIINHSGASMPYYAPDGSNEIVDNDKADVWIGIVKEFNDITAVTPTQSLSDIKFAYFGVATLSNIDIDIDNILIDPIPSIPVSLSPSNITYHSFIANWQTVSNVTGYRIDVARDALFTDSVSGLWNVVISGQSTNFLQINNLVANTTYYYRVRAINQYTEGELGSGYSFPQNALTPLCVQNPLGVISSNANPTCGSAILSYQPATISSSYYWQTFAGGTSIINTASGNSLYSVNSTGIYYVRAYDSINACWSDSSISSSTIVILPLPSGSIFADTNAVCQNGNSPVITFSGSGGTIPYTFSYTSNGGNVQTFTTGGTNTNISFPVATNNDTIFMYHLIKVTDALGCSHTENKDTNISVYSLPSASMTGDTILCAGQGPIPLHFAALTGTAPFSFFYSKNGLSQTSLQTVASDTMLQVNTTNSGTLFYFLSSITDAHGCSQTQSGNAIVQIEPLPLATINGSTSICQNSTSLPILTFNGLNASSPYTFIYGIDGVTQPQLISTGTSATIQALTSSVGIHTFHLDSISSANGCGTLIHDTAFITIRTLPTATLIGAATVCQHSNAPLVTFNGYNGTPPYTFIYEVNNTTQPGITTIGNASSVTVNCVTDNSGTFEYKLLSITDVNGCTQNQTDSIAITISPSINASISVSDNSGLTPNDGIICFGATATLTANPSNAVSYLWSNGDTTSSIVVSTSDTFSVEVHINQNCTSNVSRVIIAKPLPFATILGDTTLCANAGTTVPITMIGSGGDWPYTFTYNINGGNNLTASATIGNGVTLSIPTDVPSSAVYNLLSVNDANQCEQNQSGARTILINPTPSATISGNATVCQNTTPSKIKFTGTNGMPPFIFNYSINGLNQIDLIVFNSSDTLIDAPTNLDGSFVYTLLGITSANGCSSNVNNQSVTVDVKPSPDATISGSTTVCKNTAGSTITLTGFNATQPTTYTFDFTINNSNSSTNTTSTISTNGTSNNTTIPIVTTTEGTFNYILNTVSYTNGCSLTIHDSATVIIRSLPTASISTNVSSICQNSNSPIISFSGSNGVPPYTFAYSINGVNQPSITTLGTNNSIDLFASATTANPFNFGLVSVTDSFGCSQTQIGNASLTVHPLPTASIVLIGNNTVCQNTASAPKIKFSCTYGSSPFIITYQINNGSNQSAQVYAADTTIDIPTNVVGTFVYNLISISNADGCSQNQSGSVAITINPLPNATVTSVSEICQNATSIVTFTGNNGTAPYTFYYNVNGNSSSISSLGNNNIRTIPALSSSADTNIYTITSVADGIGCIRTLSMSDTMIVHPKPRASISGDTAVCLNENSPQIALIGRNGSWPYQFHYKINTGSNQSISTIGNDTIVEFNVPTNLDGSFTYHLVSVTDSFGCSRSYYPANDSIATTIVHPLPSATSSGTTAVCQYSSEPPIKFTGVVGTMPFTFTHHINSSGYLNNTTNTGMFQIDAPTNVTGQFLYQLDSVKDAYGCKQQVVGQLEMITIKPLPTASIDSNITICQYTTAPPSLTFTGIDGVPPYVFTYDKDGTIETIQTNNSFNTKTIQIPTDTAGIFHYHLTSVTDANTCTSPQLTDSVILQVNALPKATLFLSDTLICSNDINPSLTLMGYNTTPPYTFKYNEGSNTIDLQIVGIDTTFQIQKQHITYNLISIADGNGCSRNPSGFDSTTATLNVTQAPTKPIFTAFASHDDTTLCRGSSFINFEVSDIDQAINYVWLVLGSGAVVANIHNPNTLISFNGDGPYTIINTDSTNGCRNADTMNITMNLLDSISLRKIFIKQPGNLLIYPDNHMDTYQWGYDSIIHIGLSDSIVLSKPHNIANQVYQMFIPESTFIKNSNLDTSKYAFWVFLTKGECESKVYYNGPYVKKSQPVTSVDNTVHIALYPNPSLGDLHLDITGKIYGQIVATLYNSIGQVVYTDMFEKKQMRTTFSIQLNDIANGTYLMVLHDNDHQTYTSKITIQH